MEKIVNISAACLANIVGIAVSQMAEKWRPERWLIMTLVLFDL
jgi:hypothetical protein